MECRSGADRPHSALMLAARITLAHFSVSSAMSLPKSAGEPVKAYRESPFSFTHAPQHHGSKKAFQAGTNSIPFTFVSLVGWGFFLLSPLQFWMRKLGAPT